VGEPATAFQKGKRHTGILRTLGRVKVIRNLVKQGNRSDAGSLLRTEDRLDGGGGGGGGVFIGQQKRETSTKRIKLLPVSGPSIGRKRSKRGEGGGMRRGGRQV